MRRIVALADTDSYVKWAAALLEALPDDVETELVIVETPLAVSAGQLRNALAGTRIDPETVRRVEFGEVPAILDEAAPDAVLMASRGPVVRVLAATVASLVPRPVIVTGLPGISIPATTAAMLHRTQCDLFVLHSTREVREFTELARHRGLAQRFALSTLPFAAVARTADRSAGGTDLVFASQAIVPRERADRVRVARMLVAAAAADPTRRVVVKERAVGGEQQTHRQKYSYPDLLATVGPVPSNLVVSHAPMLRALDDAEGLVTVSSTAAIEAVARGVPVIVLDSFGVDDRLINPVFVGSGLFGSEDAVRERDFRMPAEGWLADNYFHDRAADDWVAQLDELVALRRGGVLAPKPARERRGGRVRDVWERKLAFGRHDRSLAGAVVLVVGVPLRFVLRPILRPYHRRRLRAA
ncbi:hypothetical protein GCM10022200_17060 [Microbacterium awajiense]|uniref:Uncharacterized protein n=1 Tax=Microbacterium awajiense TaxID=415214 RepID=A0ABP7AJZ2_9MICO